MKIALCALILTVATSGLPSGPAPIPAPSPLQYADICNGMYGDKDENVLAKAEDMPFIVLSRTDKNLLALVKKLRTRVLTYVTFYQMPPGRYFQHANISDHPDWVCIHPDGKDGLSVFDYEGEPKRLATCPNSFGFHDYAIKTARLTMEMGVDGLFIDNAHPYVICDGPKFNKHRHIYPGKDNTYAYRRLLEDIREEVRKYGKDKFIIVNPGNPNAEWRGACDGQMLESYICSWAWDNRWKEEKILKYQRELGPWTDKGDAVVALSYVGHTKNSTREDSFYCYAWARLSGFIWADWFTGKDVASDLYKVRLGKPLGPMKTCDGYYMREFEMGMVVTSSESKGGSFRINVKQHPSVLDLFNAKFLKAGPSGNCDITLDKGQGRVYTW